MSIREEILSNMTDSLRPSRLMTYILVGMLLNDLKKVTTKGGKVKKETTSANEMMLCARVVFIKAHERDHLLFPRRQPLHLLLLATAISHQLVRPPSLSSTTGDPWCPRLSVHRWVCSSREPSLLDQELTWSARTEERWLTPLFRALTHTL